MRVMVTVGPATELGGVHTGVRFQARPGIEVTNVNVISPWLVSAGQPFPVGVRVELVQDDDQQRTVQDILADAMKHQEDHPGHGLNCICMDSLIWELRRVMFTDVPEYPKDDEEYARTWEHLHSVRSRVGYILTAAVRNL